MQPSVRPNIFAVRRIAFVGVCAVGPASGQNRSESGHFFPTGPAAFLGDPEQKTLENYVDRINAAGGRDRP
jgi:hypothetical protein